MLPNKKLSPIHPGKILKDHFLIPRQISQAELARSIKVSLRRINDICQGKRGITPDTALRLALYFDLEKEGVEFWLNLQQRYEKECWKDYLETKQKEIIREVHPYSHFKSL